MSGNHTNGSVNGSTNGHSNGDSNVDSQNGHESPSKYNKFVLRVRSTEVVPRPTEGITVNLKKMFLFASLILKTSATSTFAKRTLIIFRFNR